MLAGRARALALGNDEIQWLETIVRNHMRIHFHTNRLVREGKPPSRRAISRQACRWPMVECTPPSDTRPSRWNVARRSRAVAKACVSTGLAKNSPSAMARRTVRPEIPNNLDASDIETRMMFIA